MKNIDEAIELLTKNGFTIVYPIPITVAWTRRLAHYFGLNLRTNLPPEQVFQLVRDNELETDPTICHSHDFCDPNVFMLDAFESVFGIHVDIQNQEHIEAMNFAWALAKKNKFQPLNWE